MTSEITAEDFVLQYDAERTFPFFDDENGVYGHGHIDKAEFAAGVNEYDIYCGADPLEGYYGERDVQWGWATSLKDDDSTDFLFVFAKPDDEGAFPVTWIAR